MDSIKLTSRGDWSKTRKWLDNLSKERYLKVLDSLGREGVNALASATPVRTGRTASSWSYTVAHNSKETSIQWTNSNTTINGEPVVILLQYGHGTGTGGYVQGRDFINPAMKPVFDSIAAKVVAEVVNS